MNFFKNFAEVAKFYRSLNREEKDQLILNLSDDLGEITNEVTQQKIVNYFYRSDADFGIRIANQLGFSQKDLNGL